uniref:Endoplasmic reticulum vesicle transporter C-terminal domain-containing protein n=1 Tax=Globisporangium ultimum (strain ATCC 200006 / CBS 805.95 / DAOM BR144) TaxID=431595 RepID=K3W884_GLOUD
MAAPNVPWLAKLRKMDAYPKTIEEFKVRTMQGGVFSLLAFVFISLLLFSEVRYYFAVDTVDKMMVDGTRNHMVPIYFDIEFPRMPCAIVAVETSDMSGAIQIDIIHNIEKVAIDYRGQVLKESVTERMGGALTNHTDLHDASDKPACGSCYAAGAEGQCCNTCDEVKAAYASKNWQMPSLHTVSQCQEAEVEKILRGEVKEGCRIKGSLLVSKVAGKIYFAPSKYFRNGYLSARDLVDATFKVFDTSHKIESLSFGESFPDMKNPLDKRYKILNDDTRGSYQYFLKVVPTEYSFLSQLRIVTNQFSATEHFHELTPTSEKGLPMVSFSYSFSPIMFRIEEYRKGLLQFLTSVCAIVGGVFTIMGIMDSLAFAVLNKSSNAPLSL